MNLSYNKMISYKITLKLLSYNRLLVVIEHTTYIWPKSKKIVYQPL